MRGKLYVSFIMVKPLQISTSKMSLFLEWQKKKLGRKLLI